MKRETLLKRVNQVLRAFCRVEIEGQENVPRSGAAIFASNHLGLLDAPLLYIAVGRTDITGWVADKHRANPLFAYIVGLAGGIWLDRENVDMQALRGALQWLKEGRGFGLAPEGTRSPTHAMIPAKEGASYLAIASGAPVVPAAVTGTERAGRAWLGLRRPLIKIRIGKPFQLPPMQRGARQEAMTRGTDEIMCRIAALLPAEYRGVYADHARLKELLAAAPA